MLLVKDNKSLSKLLEKMVEDIPLNCRDNYYRNIDTLELIETNEKYMKNTRQRVYAYYDIFKNIIFINSRSMKEYNVDIQSDFFLYILEHELRHAFGTQKKANIVYSGFRKIYLNKEEESKNFCPFVLDEGFVDLMCIPISHKYFKYRDLHHSLTAQLSLSVGLNTMKEAFYNNLGIEKLKEGLILQGHTPNKVDNFFDRYLNIDTNMNCSHAYTSLDSVEKTLLEFCDNKLDTLPTTRDKITLLEMFKASIPSADLSKEMRYYYPGYFKAYQELNKVYAEEIDNRLKSLYK